MFLFEMKALISDVCKTELAEEHDQMMNVTLNYSGVLSIKMLTKSGDRMVSRIVLRLSEARALEVFTNDDGTFYQFRVDGAQVPIVLTPDDCEKFMNSVEKVLV